MAGFDVADVSELAGEGPAGVVRKVRRAVGARAFGFNYFVFHRTTSATARSRRRPA